MIKIFTTKKDYTSYRLALNHDSVGIIPTMGNLHEGHLSLLKKSVEENKVSVITIFVNPKQFGPNEDFDKYPRTLDEDLAKISNLELHEKNPEKEILVFSPSNIAEIYPEGFNTTISVKGVSERLEGAKRPTHFDGVTTVVYCLFKIIKATNAYFGQKDFQQCIVIQKMVADLSLDIHLHIMPIVRNSDGLALSSRNQYLNENERRIALHLPHTLKKIELLLKTHKPYQEFIEQELLDNNWDYLEVLNATNLERPCELAKELVIIGVYRLGTTRLLDNILVHIL